MSESEIFSVAQRVHEQYYALYAQVITINFAMIVAIYYFLHRTSLSFRLATFAVYLVGMLTIVGLMLQQANVKRLAIRAMQEIPAPQRSSLITGYLDLQETWIFQAARVFQNLSLWMLAAVVAYLLLFWRNPDLVTTSLNERSRSRK